MTSSTGELLHILEIPAHELRLHDWYFEMGTKPTREGIRWRTLAQVQVFGELGGVRDGVLIINQVHVKFVGDDAWYAVLHDEKVLVRGLKNDYHAMHDEKENTTVSEINSVDEECYTKEDVRKALKTAGLDRDLDRKLVYLDAARAARRGEIRETTAGMLNHDDHGKRIRLEHITREEETLTHVKRLDNVPKVLLVLDGYIWDVDPELPVWIDDSSVPDESA